MLLLGLKTPGTPIICATDTKNNADTGLNYDLEEDALFDDLALFATQSAIPRLGTFVTPGAEYFIFFFSSCLEIAIDHD